MRVGVARVHDVLVGPRAPRCARGQERRATRSASARWQHAAAIGAAARERELPVCSPACALGWISLSSCVRARLISLARAACALGWISLARAAWAFGWPNVACLRARSTGSRHDRSSRGAWLRSRVSPRVSTGVAMVRRCSRPRAVRMAQRRAIRGRGGQGPTRRSMPRVAAVTSVRAGNGPHERWPRPSRPCSSHRARGRNDISPRMARRSTSPRSARPVPPATCTRRPGTAARGRCRCATTSCRATPRTRTTSPCRRISSPR